MKTIKLTLPAILVLFNISIARAQLFYRVISGQILLDDLAPTEAKYRPVADRIDRELKSHPDDTTSLFYRSLLYLQFNRIAAKPDLTTNEPAERLLTAKKMSDRADSLRMKNRDLKVLRAQICKELTNRYAPAEDWRFNARQLADRKEKFEYFKNLANRYYDELAVLDRPNAYNYQQLKLRD